MSSGSTSPRWTRCGSSPRAGTAAGPARQQRRGDDAAALPRDGRRVRAAARHQPPRALRADRAAVPHLLAAAAPRVVTVSSIAHHRGRPTCSRATRVRATSPSGPTRTPSSPTCSSRSSCSGVRTRAVWAWSPTPRTWAWPPPAWWPASRAWGRSRRPAPRAVLHARAVPVRTAGAEPVLGAAGRRLGIYSGPQRPQEPWPGQPRLVSPARDVGLAEKRAPARGATASVASGPDRGGRGRGVERLRVRHVGDVGRASSRPPGPRRALVRDAAADSGAPGPRRRPPPAGSRCRPADR